MPTLVLILALFLSSIYSLKQNSGDAIEFREHGRNRGRRPPAPPHPKEKPRQANPAGLSVSSLTRRLMRQGHQQQQRDDVGDLDHRV
ncbi:MAG: hypothetical protein KAR37_16820, partial [Alphaproteobacteria bacterium]|nr:hypothetical protein [Alphaproteobacteria bacterium]